VWCLFAAITPATADAPANLGAIRGASLSFARNRYLNIPIVGWRLRLAKFVPVDRGNRDAALASVKQAVEYIRPARHFWFIPRGRAVPMALQPLQEGSFVMAIEAGGPIVRSPCSGAIAS